MRSNWRRRISAVRRAGALRRPVCSRASREGCPCSKGAQEVVPPQGMRIVLSAVAECMTSR